MSYDPEGEIVIVRCLVGADTNYVIRPIENADKMYLEGYICDVIAAEGQVGDALAIDVHGHSNNFHSVHGLVASTTDAGALTTRGVVVPITTAFANNELRRSILVCRELPRHNFHTFKVQLRNAHTGAVLSVANAGATRALVTLKLRVTYRAPAPHPGAGLHPTLIAQTRFNEYL